MNEQIQEIRYQVGEAWKGTYNAATIYGNANVVQDATGLSVYRSLKSGNVGHPLTDPQWWFCIIDLSSIKAESDRLQQIDTQVENNEATRIANEEGRVSAEQARVNAEQNRIYNEQHRENSETARIRAEQDRVTQENQRISQEQGRVGAEQQRVVKEQQRVSQEASRVAAETQRQLNENNRQAVFAEDHAVAVADHQQADQDHTRAESDHETAVSDHAQMINLVECADADHVQAGQDHTRAESDHTTATSDHTQAGSDHTRAGQDHTQAGSDHTRAEEDHTASAAATEAANEAAAAANALQENLENGDVVPALAGNLESWAEDVSEVSNSWDETIRSTAGDDPIDTAYGGVLTSIVAKSDFKCDALVTSGYNLLRLASNGGVAVAVGNGWYFPVPHLELGAFGDATKNNGVLLTDKDGNNINSATVRFKALADGVPTSVDDGVVASYQDVTYNDETFRTYLTSGPGYLIVSGITYADTCAHLAWEDWYDKYVSPTAEDDAGDSISLTALFTAAPNGTGKFLVLGSGGNTVATRATRTSSTQMTITDPIGRVTSPSWTNELQEDEETYKHSLAISGMKSDGLAQIEGSDQVLTVVGTTVSYTDTNATAISGAVRYEKATAATANLTLAKTQYALNDCGIEMKSGATGEAYFGCTYSQNVADALSQIAKVKLDISLSVVAEALLYLYNENKALRELLAGKDNAVLPYIKAQTIECVDKMTMGVPDVLVSSVEGAPSAANVPDNWNEETMTVWNGCPRKIGQQYVDKVSKKVYYAVAVTGSTNDWVALN